jgi:hypothetical protein
MKDREDNFSRNWRQRKAAGLVNKELEGKDRRR